MLYGCGYYLTVTSQVQPVPTYSWYQDYWGKDTHTANGQVATDLPYPDGSGTNAQQPVHDFAGDYKLADNTAMYDAPSFPSDPNLNNNNDAYVAQGWTDVTTNETYSTWVE